MPCHYAFPKRLPYSRRLAPEVAFLNATCLRSRTLLRHGAVRSRARWLRHFFRFHLDVHLRRERAPSLCASCRCTSRSPSLQLHVSTAWFTKEGGAFLLNGRFCLLACPLSRLASNSFLKQQCQHSLFHKAHLFRTTGLRLLPRCWMCTWSLTAPSSRAERPLANSFPRAPWSMGTVQLIAIVRHRANFVTSLLCRSSSCT